MSDLHWRHHVVFLPKGRQVNGIVCLEGVLWQLQRLDLELAGNYIGHALFRLDWRSWTGVVLDALHLISDDEEGR